MSITRWLSTTISGDRIWRRLNASSWPVSVAARSAALKISSTSARSGEPDQLLQQQFGIAANRRQQVVEVVRDAAGEPADRFHLLRVAQLLFELSARGLGRLALGNLAAQLVVGAAQRRGALFDAAFEVAMRFMQRHLAGPQLLLRVVTLGHVAQDHQHLVRLRAATGALHKIAARLNRRRIRARY